MEMVQKSAKLTLNASALLAGAFTDELRRDMISYHFSQPLKSCCNFEIDHESENLFGDNLTKRITEWKSNIRSLEGRSS